MNKTEFTDRKKALIKAEKTYNTQSEYSIKRTLTEYDLKVQALGKYNDEIHELLFSIITVHDAQSWIKAVKKVNNLLNQKP